eukprot:TRINITY_DN3120_c0_g1_i3.p1 TRINITY_DN3120_c0_g1~~TRINITY_DN3120_c0_g1_i3.p1  ORF type:complete len:112 (-),score=13.06 TRINITY_DN3120_c0_g1_i3:322-657(-)
MLNLTLSILTTTLYCFPVVALASTVCFIFFFFFKQKTAYEMLRSLVGSEMCIRDRCTPACGALSRTARLHATPHTVKPGAKNLWRESTVQSACNMDSYSVSLLVLVQILQS